MKYTPEDLRKMSDADINLAVARKLYPKYEILAQGIRDVEDVCLGLPSSYKKKLFNPCFNWHQVMGIAEDNKIDVCFPEHGGSLCCSKDRYENISENPNPRRAICEVFLMMG
jgi:hypothetical protein